MSDALTTEYERWCDAFHEGSDAVKRIAQETLDLRAEVERLEELHGGTVADLHELNIIHGRTRALLERRHAICDKRDDEICAEAHAEGMEQAAKLLHDQGYFKSAAAIRAEIASATVSHADGADSTDTRSSDG